MMVCRNVSRAILSASALLGAVAMGSTPALAQTQLLCMKQVTTNANKRMANAYLTRRSKCNRGYVAAVVGDARFGTKGLVGATGPQGAPGPKGDKGDTTLPPGVVTEAKLEERFLSPIPSVSYEYTMLPSYAQSYMDVIQGKSPRTIPVGHTIQISGFARLLSDGTWETRIVKSIASHPQTISQAPTGPSIVIPKSVNQVDDTGYVKGMATFNDPYTDSSWVSAWFVEPKDGHAFPILRASGFGDKLKGYVCGQSVIDNRSEASAFTKKVCTPSEFAKE